VPDEDCAREALLVSALLRREGREPVPNPASMAPFSDTGSSTGRHRWPPSRPLPQPHRSTNTLATLDTVPLPLVPSRRKSRAALIRSVSIVAAVLVLAAAWVDEPVDFGAEQEPAPPIQPIAPDGDTPAPVPTAEPAPVALGPAPISTSTVSPPAATAPDTTSPRPSATLRPATAPIPRAAPSPADRPTTIDCGRDSDDSPRNKRDREVSDEDDEDEVDNADRCRRSDS